MEQESLGILRSIRKDLTVDFRPAVDGFDRMAQRFTRPSFARLKMDVKEPKLISIAMDGDSVCTLIGSDLQVGIAGFGTTIAESIDNFCSAWQNASHAEREDAIKSVLGTIPLDRLNAALSRSI